jgi:hypothetical protein
MLSRVPPHERLYSIMDLDLGSVLSAIMSGTGAIGTGGGMCSMAAAKEGQVGVQPRTCVTAVAIWALICLSIP